MSSFEDQRGENRRHRLANAAWPPGLRTDVFGGGENKPFVENFQDFETEVDGGRGRTERSPPFSRLVERDAPSGDIAKVRHLSWRQGEHSPPILIVTL